MICIKAEFYEKGVPDNKVHGVNMGPSGADRTQVGPMLSPWILLSGMVLLDCLTKKNNQNSFSSILLKNDLHDIHDIMRIMSPKWERTHKISWAKF